MRQTKETSGLVLVVEDNRNISEMIGEYLEGRGFEVDYACDGLDGYRLAAENSYDVVVLDLMLPRLDGIEVCKRLREEARKSTPVLMLTARDTLDEKLTGLGSGADDYLTKPLAIQELERCVDQLGLQGVQIGSHIGDWNLDAPELFPFFEAAADLGAAILVHPWDMMGSESMPKYWLPWLVGMPAEQSRAACCLIFGGVLQRLPKLKICMAHGGGSFPYTIGRIEHGFNMRPDLVATDNPHNPRGYLKQLYFDSWVADPRALQYLIETCGVERVMLGTDYPFPLGEQVPGAGIEEIPLGDVERARLYHGTALEWLGLPPSRFL